MQRVLMTGKIKSFLVAAAVFIVSFANCSAVFAREGLVKITDNVYSYVGVKDSGPQNSYGSNAGIIIGKDGIAVVDTLISAKEAQRFIKDIRSISDKPIKYVINTHYHMDHTFGNAEFIKLGAIVIAHSSDKISMEKFGEHSLKNKQNFGLTEKDMEGTALAFPALSFSNNMEIDLGDRKIKLIYPGPTHTGGSIMIYLPDEKILFAGDILSTDYHPMMAEGDIDCWVKALDSILQMDTNAIIPGHGPLSTRKDIQDMKKYLLVFDEAAWWLCGHSKDAGFIAASMKALLPGRAEGDVFIKPGIELKYLKSTNEMILKN